MKKVNGRKILQHPDQSIGMLATLAQFNGGIPQFARDVLVQKGLMTTKQVIVAENLSKKDNGKT
jgi:hypothetical protein